MQSQQRRAWHHLPTDEVMAVLESDPDIGLSDSEVTHRRRRFGLKVLVAQPAAANSS